MSKVRVFFPQAALMIAAVAGIVGCGQSGNSAQPSTQASVTTAGRVRPFPPPIHPPHPFPFPIQTWHCQVIGKDGDVFGTFDGTGSTQAAATANGMSACQAVRVYASCFVDGCSVR